MKRIILFFLILSITVMFFGCEKDEEPGYIIGTQYYIAYSLEEFFEDLTYAKSSAVFEYSDLNDVRVKNQLLLKLRIPEINDFFVPNFQSDSLTFESLSASVNYVNYWFSYFSESAQRSQEVAFKFDQGAGKFEEVATHFEATIRGTTAYAEGTYTSRWFYDLNDSCLVVEAPTSNKNDIPSILSGLSFQKYRSTADGVIKLDEILTLPTPEGA